MALGYAVLQEDALRPDLAQRAQACGVTGIFFALKPTDMSSTSVLSELHQYCPHVPVIVMGIADEVTQLRGAVDHGAKEYLVKPFDPELLKRKCCQVFGELRPEGDSTA